MRITVRASRVSLVLVWRDSKGTLWFLAAARFQCWLGCRFLAVRVVESGCCVALGVSADHQGGGGGLLFSTCLGGNYKRFPRDGSPPYIIALDELSRRAIFRCVVHGRCVLIGYGSWAYLWLWGLRVWFTVTGHALR